MSKSEIKYVGWCYECKYLGSFHCGICQRENLSVKNFARLCLGLDIISPFCPKYGEMVYYVTVSGYIQEVRFDTDSTLHQLLRKAGKLYRSEEEAKRYLDKDYKDLIIQEEE